MNFKGADQGTAFACFGFESFSEGSSTFLHFFKYFSVAADAMWVGMWQPFCKDLLMNNVRPEERCGLSWGTCGWCKNRNEGQEDRGDVGGRGGASARPQLQPPGHSGAGSMRLLKSTHDRDQQRHRSQEWQTDRARSLSSAQRRPRLAEGSGGRAQALGGSSRACALPPVDPLPGHERGASVLLDGAEL